MSKITSVNVLIILGIILMLSGGGGANLPQGDTSHAITGGALLLLGALAISARKRQFLKPSTKWRVIEAISLVIITFIFIRGIISGLWYDHPISFLGIPTFVILAWGRTIYIHHKHKSSHQ